jgi:RNA polymerase sigma factor (sigma-70 family)
MTAISRTTTTTDFRTISPDTDLAERAAAGEQDAFEELYRRHVQPAWRFAQAVSPNRDSACEAADEAFVRVLRVVRRGRAAAAQNFRAYLLAAVYRNALEALRANGRAEDSSEAASPDASDDELLGVAFRSLPERWRAALWLTDVEHIAVQDVAPILGVSTAVTGQMVTRARTGLTNRFQQAGRANDLPDVPATLRAGALALPTGLAEATLARWKRAMAAERRRVIPAAGWLTDRAPRPLAACAAGLLAMGLIGLGVIGQRGGFGGSTPNGPVAAPSANHQFTPPSVSLNPIGSDSFLGGSGLGASGGGANGFILPISAVAGTGAGAGAGSGNLIALGPTPGSTTPGGTPGGSGGGIVPGLPPIVPPGTGGGGGGGGAAPPVVGANVAGVAIGVGASCTGVGLGPVSLGCPSAPAAPGVSLNVPGLPPVNVPLPALPALLPPKATPPASTAPTTTTPPVTLLPPILGLPPVTLPPILPKL